MFAQINQRLRGKRGVNLRHGIRGAIDLASIMVGVIVVGIISATATVTTFAVIPWAQDEAAKAEIAAIRTAQAVAFVQHGHYLGVNELVAEGLLPAGAVIGASGPAMAGGGVAVVAAHLGVALGADASCYIATAVSDSGTTFVGTNLSPGAVPAPNAGTLDVAPACGTQLVTAASILTASGPAIYAHNASGFSGSANVSGAVHIANGDLALTGASNASELVLGNGNLALGGASSAAGDVWVSGNLRVAQAVVVSGDAVASSLEMTGTSRILGTGTIAGHSSFTYSPAVEGHLTAATFSGNVYGANNTPGGYTLVPTGPTLPAFPIVENWVEFDGSAPWHGFATTRPASAGYNDIQAAVNGFAGQPGVVDLRGMGSVSVSSNQTLTLTGDTVFLADSFSLGNSLKISGPVDARLWLIVPDANASDGVPTAAPGGGNVSISGVATITVPTMIYAPGAVSIESSVAFTGQIFAGTVNTSGASAFTGQAIGLPGAVLSN